MLLLSRCVLLAQEMIMLKLKDYNLMESTHDIIMWTKYIFLDSNVICRSTIKNIFKAIAIVI